ALHHVGTPGVPSRPYFSPPPQRSRICQQPAPPPAPPTARSTTFSSGCSATQRALCTLPAALSPVPVAAWARLLPHAPSNCPQRRLLAAALCTRVQT
ncbi:hypothetical protein NDU88_002768, partial [Pleurodeles waltl]